MFEEIPGLWLLTMEVREATWHAGDKRCQARRIVYDLRESFTETELAPVQFAVLGEEVTHISRALLPQERHEHSSTLLTLRNRRRESRIEVAGVRQLATKLVSPLARRERFTEPRAPVADDEQRQATLVGFLVAHPRKPAIDRLSLYAGSPFPSGWCFLQTGWP
jgi:hypothetical protein